MNRPTRRRILTIAAGALPGAVALRAGMAASADDAIEAHGLSSFGDLAYPPDFKHFSYVNPNAPKGGVFSQIGPDQIYNQNFLTFNSLNTFILKGDAAQGMEMTFAALMARSGDEPDAMYGLAATRVRRSTDGLVYQFFIRPEAKFHDGSPLTAHDVAFSLTILKDKGHPLISQSLRDFASATPTTTRPSPCALRRSERATCRCSSPGCRFSRAPITRRGRSTNRPSIFRSARGAYQVGRFDAGRFIEYRSRRGLVGRRSAGGRGQNNFDIVRFEYYRDRDVGFEGFIGGELSVPRGVHLALLGDALRFPGGQGRPRQSRRIP